MKYVISIDKEVGTNTYNSQFITSTENETQATLLRIDLESAFETHKLLKKTTIRSDGEFTFINLEIRKG